MELAKRLRLGVLAGALEAKGEVGVVDGEAMAVGPLEAARLGGHRECVRVLEAAAAALLVHHAADESVDGSGAVCGEPLEASSSNEGWYPDTSEDDLDWWE